MIEQDEDKSVVLDGEQVALEGEDVNAVPIGSTRLCCWGKCRKLKSRTDQLICTMGCLSIFCVIFAIVLPVVTDSLVHQGVTNVLILDSPDADTYDSFKSNTKPGDTAVSYDFYMFDLTNPEGFLYNGEKPKMMEKGPFAFHYYFHRFDISWHEGHDLIKYKTQYFYVWDEERANPGLDQTDTMRTPWTVAESFKATFVGAAEAPNSGSNAMLAKANQLLQVAPQAAPALGNLSFGNLTIQDLLHEIGPMGLMKVAMCAATGSALPIIELPVAATEFGYWDDPLMLLFDKLLQTLAPGTPWINYVPGICDNNTSVEDARARTNFDTVHTGKKDIKKVNQYTLYQNMTAMFVCGDATASPGGTWDNDLQIPPTCGPFQEEWSVHEAGHHGWKLAWDGPPDGASAVEGTTGQQYPPRFDNNHWKDRTLFLDDIYRSVTLEVKENSKVGGIKTHRLGLRDEDLLSGNCDAYPDDCYPANLDFYAYGPPGILNFSQVAGNIPYFASKPHYLDADPLFVEMVEGVTPSKDLHDTYLDVDPYTGLVLSAAERLQYLFNVADWDMPSLPLYKYFNWSAAIVEPIREEMVTKLETVAMDKIKEGLTHEAQVLCNASSAKHAGRCAAVADAVEAGLKQRCQAVNVSESQAAATACTVLEDMAKLVNKTEQVLPEVIEYCQANPDTCAGIATAVETEVATFCSANHTLAHALCQVVEGIVHEVENVWTALNSFCHTSECEVITNLIDFVEDGAIRHSVAEHCTDRLETREARCTAIDNSVANTTAAFCNSDDHAHAAQFCAFVDEALFHYTEGEFIDEIQAYCSGSKVHQVECAGARAGISAFCTASPSVCNATDYVIEHWATIDGKVLTLLDDWDTLCSSTVCTGVDTMLLTAWDQLVNHTCAEHDLGCEMVELAAAGNLSTVVEQAVQALESEATAFCSQDQLHADLCADVRALGKDVVVDNLEKIFEQLGIQDQVAEAVEVYECLASDTDFNIPSMAEGGTYIPIGWSERAFTLNDDDLHDLKSSIYDTQDLADQIAWWLYAAGICFFAVGAGLAGARYMARRPTPATVAGKAGVGGAFRQNVSADMDELVLATEDVSSPLVDNQYRV